MSNPFEALEQRLDSIELYLSQLINSISKFHPTEQSDTLSVEEVSKILNLSVQTIYGRTSRKTIPHIKKGKKLMFSRKRIEAYIADGEVKTLSAEFRASEKLISEKSKRNI